MQVKGLLFAWFSKGNNTKHVPFLENQEKQGPSFENRTNKGPSNCEVFKGSSNCEKEGFDNGLFQKINIKEIVLVNGR